jgi:nucleoid DNA-binding protein
MARMMRTRTAVLREAMSRGAGSLGGLVRAVYGSTPRDRRARKKAAKLKFYALRGGAEPRRSGGTRLQKGEGQAVCRKKASDAFGTADVYRAVAERGGYKKREVRACLDLLAEVMAEALAAGRTVRYAPLGTFKPVARKRRGRNESRVTVRFRPARKMLTALNPDLPEERRAGE